jgi:dUTPase
MSICESLLEQYGQYMSLKIFIENGELTPLYQNAINVHNEKLRTKFIDAGFDLYAVPMSSSHPARGVPLKMDFEIICSARMILADRSYNTGYYLYPRSSLSNSNLRLANSTGIIDAGYRGHIIGMFDVLTETRILNYDKLVQICAPGLVPIVVTLVDQLEDLGEQTQRGTGGFGSTGG